MTRKAMLSNNSFGYCAPELYFGKYLGIKSDIWSLGITFYSLLKNNKLIFGLYKDYNTLFNNYKIIFNNENNNNTNKNCDIVFRYISDSCVDIISKMIRFNYEKRYGIDKLLKHSFFKENVCEYTPCHLR